MVVFNRIQNKNQKRGVSSRKVEGGLVERAQLLRLLPVARLVNGLDALEGERASGQAYWPAVAVLVVLALPDEYGFGREREWGLLGPQVGWVLSGMVVSSGFVALVFQEGGQIVLQ